MASQLDEGVGKDAGVGGRPGLALGLLASHNIKLSNAVHPVWRAQCRRVSVALLRLHVQQHRLLAVAIAKVLDKNVWPIIKKPDLNTQETKYIQESYSRIQATARIFAENSRW